jgi:SpoVK/Ycf46/Vps4 family AAA+-type ATPase
MPSEFARAERFDGVFFVDLPTRQQRDAIWRMYLDRFGLDARQARPADEDWTGAEIRSCCPLAALLDVPLAAAAQNVVPIARTAGEAVDKLRTWATGRCLSADRSGIYQRAEQPQSGGPRRRIPRDSSVN